MKLSVGVILNLILSSLIGTVTWQAKLGVTVAAVCCDYQLLERLRYVVMFVSFDCVSCQSYFFPIFSLLILKNIVCKGLNCNCEDNRYCTCMSEKSECCWENYTSFVQVMSCWEKVKIKRHRILNISQRMLLFTHFSIRKNNYNNNFIIHGLIIIIVNFREQFKTIRGDFNHTFFCQCPVVSGTSCLNYS